jgi:site-specific recombinase XerD
MDIYQSGKDEDCHQNTVVASKPKDNRKLQRTSSMYNKGTLLPVLTNQKYNSYLKELADICGIYKNLTTHTARHTFATTVTLSNGAPIESVSKMLGHKKLQTTQHYARVLDIKVSEDMKALRYKFHTLDDR